MTTTTYMPSASLLARFESEATEASARAADQNASAESVEARVRQLQTTQDKGAQQLNDLLAQADQLRAELNERKQDIDTGRTRAEQHRASAAALQADADYLAAQVRQARGDDQQQRPPAYPLPSGVVAASGPPFAAPATPAEMAAQLKKASETPECLTCHAPIAQDALGFKHTSTGTAYCYEGSSSYVIRVPAGLEVTA